MNSNEEDTYNTRPSSVVASRLALEISAFFVLQDSAQRIGDTWRYICHAFQWSVLGYGINNVLLGSGSEGFLIRLLDGLNWRIFGVLVACEAGSVIWSFVMVTSRARAV